MTLNFKRRSDYTHQYNINQGRHGWLRLTPAYSVKVVNEIIEDIDKDLVILDPFNGTGTTPLTAAYKGFKAYSTDINEFLIWLSKAKSETYSDDELNNLVEMADEVVALIGMGSISPVAPPPIKNIERWWNKEALSFLCELMGIIKQVAKDKPKEKDLLLVTFCRVMIKVSNASFNHQSMSFKAIEDQLTFETELFGQNYYVDIFKEELAFILESSYLNPKEKFTVIKGDARNISEHIPSPINLVITSPPYPNRMSYIRELRPYMYWLGYLKEAKEAGELDWEAIGGTWGIATSRLSTWAPKEETFYPPYLKDILKNIEASHDKNGRTMSNYIAKYFEDMWEHLVDLRKILTEGAELHYIVGNSTFYNIILPVEEVFKSMFIEAGYTNVEIKTIRKRNSKKELFEFDVIAKF